MLQRISQREGGREREREKEKKKEGPTTQVLMEQGCFIELCVSIYTVL